MPGDRNELLNEAAFLIDTIYEMKEQFYTKVIDLAEAYSRISALTNQYNEQLRMTKKKINRLKEQQSTLVFKLKNTSEASKNENTLLSLLSGVVSKDTAEAKTHLNQKYSKIEQGEEVSDSEFLKNVLKKALSSENINELSESTMSSAVSP